MALPGQSLWKTLPADESLLSLILHKLVMEHGACFCNYQTNPSLTNFRIK